jgi:hypothetical protein
MALAQDILKDFHRKLKQKFFLLVLVLLLLASVAFFVYVVMVVNSDRNARTYNFLPPNNTTSTSPSTTISDPVRAYDTKEECEEDGDCSCAIVNCDLIPEGTTFEEACGKNFQEGWQCVGPKVGMSDGDPVELEPDANISDVWVMYDSQTYNFSFSHPVDFIPYDHEQPQELFGLRSKERNYVIIVNVVVGTPLHEHVEALDAVRETAFHGMNSVNILQSREASVAGFPAVQREIQGTASGLNAIETFMEVSSEEQVISITLRGDNKEIDNNFRKLNSDILDTFRAK